MFRGIQPPSAEHFLESGQIHQSPFVSSQEPDDVDSLPDTPSLPRRIPNSTSRHVSFSSDVAPTPIPTVSDSSFPQVTTVLDGSIQDSEDSLPPSQVTDSLVTSDHLNFHGQSLPNPSKAPQSTNVISDLSSKLDWDSEVNDFSALDAYLANQEFSIPLDTLTHDVPAGLGFSSNCKEWLTLLDINTWNDLVFHSFRFSIDRLMLRLTVPVYFEYRKDLRRFLIFGLLCNPNSSHSLPTRRTLKNWIPRYVLLLRAHLQDFTNQEKQAVSILRTQNSVSSSQKPSFDHPT